MESEREGEQSVKRKQRSPVTTTETRRKIIALSESAGLTTPNFLSVVTSVLILQQVSPILCNRECGELSEVCCDFLMQEWHQWRELFPEELHAITEIS